MTEGIDTVLYICGEVVCYFKGYFKAGLLVAGDAVMSNFCL